MLMPSLKNTSMHLNSGRLDEQQERTSKEMDGTGSDPDNGCMGEKLMVATQSGFKVKAPKNFHPLIY